MTIFRDVMTLEQAMTNAWHTVNLGGKMESRTLAYDKYDELVNAARIYGFSTSQIVQYLSDRYVLRGPGGKSFLSSLFSNKMILYPGLFFLATRLFSKK